MSVVVVTRLRLRDPALLDDFFAAAVAVLEQAKQSDGSLGSDVLADAEDTWWTVTLWADREHMRSFVAEQPHLATEDHLDEWCDEASFVDWDQDGTEIPDWPTCYAHLLSDGYSGELTDPSPANASRSFPPPVEPAA